MSLFKETKWSLAPNIPLISGKKRETRVQYRQSTKFQFPKKQIDKFKIVAGESKSQISSHIERIKIV